MEGNVSLVTLIEYADASAEVKAVYDDIMRTRGVDWVNNFWKALANDPAQLRRIWDNVKQVMAPGALDPLVKEMVYVAVSATNGCEYCTYSHTAAARKPGRAAPRKDRPRCKRVSGRLKYFLAGALLRGPPQGEAWGPRTGTTAAPQPARKPGKSRIPTFRLNTAASWNWSATAPIPPCFDPTLAATPNRTWTSGWRIWKSWLSSSQCRTAKPISTSPAPSTSPRCARSSKPWRRKSRSGNPRRPRFSGTDHAFIARIEPFD